MKYGNYQPSLKELVDLCEPSNPQISPNGSMIAYMERSVDWEDNRYQDDLWLVDLSQSPPQFRQLIEEPCAIWSYQWSPSGEWLAFGCHQAGEDTPTLELLNPITGEQRTVCELTTGGYAFSWSPDGKQIAYIAGEMPDTPEKETSEKAANATVMDQHWSKDQLWLVTVEDAAPAQITTLDLHINGFDWHPDGGKVVFSAVPTPDENVWDQCRIYILDLADGTVNTLTEVGCHKPQFSPDGTHILYKQLGTPSFIDVSTMKIMDITGSNSRTLRPFDNETYLLQWRAEGIYLMAIEGVTTHIYCMDPQSAQVEQLTADDPPGFAIPEGWIGWGCSFTADGSQIAFLCYDRDHFAELALLDTRSKEQTILTNNSQKLFEWKLPKPELFRWKNPDGDEIEGILIKPVDVKEGLSCPLVVVAHGGPTHTSMLPVMIDGDWWYGGLPQMLNKGAMVLFVNYRGSNGYGAAFQKANVLTLGVTELADVISGVDALVGKGWVDRERVGIVGMSHGGYLAAFAATYSDRFSAAVMLSGISDWALNYYMTDTRVWMQQYLHGAPWEMPETYRAVSPVSYLAQAKTPLLIQHGERDNRAPIANAHAIYRGLRDSGVPVRLVIYPEQGHGIGNPIEFQRCIEETCNWFSEWLWK
ncbi:MAG: S9 family peptidase [Anaerolineae bacterium]|jgi:dipeptidyl aminopeptidase/acylaminoacyl peptidase|nr:S9 family peptidase [Anaerolineae bacterium]